MHFRSTGLLVTVAIALFVYIAFFERPGTETRSADELARLVFPELDPARVTALTITRSNVPMRLVRTEGRWQLTDPTYPAQGLLVDNWVRSLAELRRSSHLEPADVGQQPGGLAALGLEPPRAIVVIEQGDQRFEGRLGDRTLLGETMYLQLTNSTGVEVAGSTPLDRLPAGPATWRDPQFLNLSGVRFDRLQMRAPAREYAVQRDPTSRRWRLTKPRPARADHGRIEQLLQQLQTLNIQAFANDHGVADLEPFGLQPPQASLTFSQGTNDLMVLDFGQSPTNTPDLIFARRSHLAGLVLIPRETLDWVAVPYSELLDYRLIDRPIEQVDRIEVVAREPFTLARGTNGVWSLQGTTTLPADPGLVGAFLEQLRGLRVQEVAKEVVTEMDLPTYGLADSTRHLKLHWEQDGLENQLLIELGATREEQIFVRRSDENPVYAVALKDVLALPRAAFDLRDRQLWRFGTNEVTSVTIMTGSATNQLLRSPRGQWAFAEGSQGVVNTFALEEALHRLGDLRARFWVERGAEALGDYGIPQVNHRLAIGVVQAGRPATFSLAFGASSPSGGPFAATLLDGEPTIFECPLDVYYPYDEVVRSLSPLSPGGP